MYYVQHGSVPRQRHTQHRAPDGSLYAEELFGVEGFTGRSSLLYHLVPPTQTHLIEPLREIRLEAADVDVHHPAEPDEHLLHGLRLDRPGRVVLAPRQDQVALAELLDRLHDDVELEVLADRLRLPVARPLAERREDGAKARDRFRGRGEGWHHRFEQRKAQRGAHAAEHRSTGQLHFGDKHQRLPFATPTGSSSVARF